MKNTMKLLILFFLSGCTSFEVKQICSDINRYQIIPQVRCDVSFTKNRCRCRCWDFNSWNVVDLKLCEEFKDREGKAPINFPIEYCEGISGGFLENDAVNVRPNIQALHKIKGNLCEN